MLFLVGRKTKAGIETAANPVTGHICLLIDLQEKKNGEVRESNNVKPWKLGGGSSSSVYGYYSRVCTGALPLYLFALVLYAT